MNILSKGNSKTERSAMPPVPVPRPPAVQHDQQQQLRPRDLDPAAAAAISSYRAVFDENAQLREINAQLHTENEVLRRTDAEKTAIIADLRRSFEETQSAADGRIASAEAHFRERLGGSAKEMESYRRYAMSINERLTMISEAVDAAREYAKEVSHRTSPKKLDEIEDMIAQAVTDARDVRTAETHNEPEIHERGETPRSGA